MSDPRNPLAAARSEVSADEALREERHQRLATLLGAFADAELPAETASQIDAHLLGCARCRRELQMHRTVRLRLEQEPIVAASTSFRERVMAAVAAAPTPQWESMAVAAVAEPAVETPAKARSFHVPRMVVVVGAVMSVALGALGVRTMVRQRAPLGSTVVAASSVPILGAALDDYRRVTRGDLPGRGRDLAVVRDAVPFPVQPLQHDGLRLLAAWTTSLNGEPAAVLAYRWRERVVLQYIVSDLELYRAADARAALGEGRLLASHDGGHNVVAWPDAASGSLVIGDLPLPRLGELRNNPDTTR
jgi:anti-sigma factor RsiW